MTGRVMFYVQHLLGIGHLARASLICEGLVKQGLEVKMVMGGEPVAGFPGNGVDVAHLPVLKAGCIAFNDLIDENGKLADQHYLDNRRDQLLKLFDEYRPDILVIEAFPFGRRQMRFELIPLLEKAKQADWSPQIAGSLRDILQQKTKMKRLEETVATLNKYFDLLMVHGDPQFVTLGETFALAHEIEHLIAYTGIVSAEVPSLTGPRYDVVVSAGGGAAGELIMLNALSAKPLTSLANASWCFITGPNLSQDIRQRLVDEKPENVTIETHRTDFRALLAHARLSISQAGYNTTADILRAGCRSVLVPFSSGGETEQTHRATRLAERGLAMVIAEKGITPQRMAEVIDQAVINGLADKVSISNTPPLALDGAQQSAKLLAGMVEHRKTNMQTIITNGHHNI